MEEKRIGKACRDEACFEKASASSESATCPEMPSASVRDVRWDLLRSVAMFCIVIIHCAPRLAGIGGTDVSQWVSTFFLVFDPVFFALSGYLAIRPLKKGLGQYYAGKLIGIIVPVLLYSVIAYFVASKLTNLSFGGYVGYLDYLLGGAWWFVPTLVPMLVLAPFLYLCFEGLDDKWFALLVRVLLAFAAWGVLCDAVASLPALGAPEWANGLANAMEELLPPNVEPLSGYALFFCMGYAVRRYEERLSGCKLAPWLVFCLACLVVDATVAQLGLHRSIPSHLWVFATPVVFMVFSRVRVTSARTAKALEWTSRRSYSIYLFQAAAIVILGGLIYDSGAFGDVTSAGVPVQLLVWLALVLGSYALSWVAASVLDTFLLNPIQKELRGLFSK